MNSGTLARTFHHVVLIATMRALSLISLLVLAGIQSGFAQVESAGQKRLGLDMGIVASEQHPISLTKGGELSRTEGAPVELKDFSLSFVLELEAKAGGDHYNDFLLLDTDGGLLVISAFNDLIHVRMGEMIWDANATLPLSGRKVPVTLSVKRDARQALAGLWVDGVECSSLIAKPGVLRLKARPISIGSNSLKGAISQIRLNDRALGRDEIMALASRAMTQDRKPPSAFAEPVAWLPNETIAVIGGSEAVALMEDGTLEAMLLTNSPGNHLKLRSLAWETDTVWRQDRPLNFGQLPQQLERVNATTVMLMFGRQECLERAGAGMDAFRASLEQMLKTCASWTPRIILVCPPPFEAGIPPQPDLKPLNEVLAKYHQVIKEVAAKHHVPFTPLVPGAEPPTRLTRDGLNLNSEGIHRLAAQIASLISHSAVDPSKIDPDFRAAIRAKNRLWHDYWRPSNWAFLYGDRTAQPSSRDHLNPQVRWFPAELEKSRALIEAKEQEIWKQASELERRVP